MDIWWSKIDLFISVLEINQGIQICRCQNKQIEYSIMSRNKYQPNVREHQIKKVSNYMFDLADQIGAGFSSKVYKGTDCRTGGSVAIKVVDLKKLSNPVEKTLLANETKALSIMNHLNILKAEHTIQTANNFYIVTELFQQNLDKLLATQGAQSQAQTIKILQAVGKGMGYLQKIGIIHRDIKPANIFISKDRCVVGDFGFCHFMSMPCLQQGYNVGSPFYMSPQSYKFSKYSYKSDIWALGITVLEILAGRKPFVSMNFDTMVKEICEKKCYRQFNISDPLKQLLDKMLEFDLEKRITPLELLEILMRFPKQSEVFHVEPIEGAIIATNQRQINFKNNQRRRVSPPTSLGNQQNLNSGAIHCSNNRKCVQPLTQRKIVNFREASHPKVAETYHHIPPNPKFICLQNLAKIMLADPKLSQNPYKLKLLRILAILPHNQFPTYLVPFIETLQIDDYFNYILLNTTPKSFSTISHYLTFLLQKVSMSYQASNKKNDQNEVNIIGSLDQALNLWRKSNLQEKNINSSTKKIKITSLSREKSRSVGNLNSGLAVIRRN